MAAEEPDEEPYEIDASAVSDYLSKKGAVAILVAISDGGRRFNELSESIDISTSTLYRRLIEGREAGVITADAKETETGMVDVYRPAPAGKALRERMSDIQLIRVYWELQSKQEQFEELKDGLREWVVDEDSRFEQNGYNYWHVENRDGPPVRKRDSY